ncbi:hypothetical protein ACFS4T_25025 [Pseudomonas lini]
MVLAMHAGFAFLEVGTVRQKNQVNALSKNPQRLRHFDPGLFLYRLLDFLRSHFHAAGGGDHRRSWLWAGEIFFFLLTFAAAIPAIISGGIAERARFAPQLCATALIVAFIYPFFEGMIWNGNFWSASLVVGTLWRQLP